MQIDRYTDGWIDGDRGEEINSLDIQAIVGNNVQLINA